MKLFFLILVGGAALLATACTKVKTYRELPVLEGPDVVDALASQRSWVEQVAIQKADSMRIVDSLAQAGGPVDNNSLFNKKNMMVAIVEANDHFLPNVNCYRDQDGKLMFDLMFPFSANLNIDPGTGKPYVHYNAQHTVFMSNGIYTRVKSSGIKTGLSLLGNHDAAGLANFNNLADATAFAQLVAIEVRRYGFDAVLGDDEYSKITATTNDSSYVMVMSEIKRLLPDKFICFYVYGFGYGSWRGKKMGDVCDAAFPPYYPQYPDNSFQTTYRFPKSRCFASCSETAGGFGNPAQVMAQLNQEGYKGCMFYNVCGRSTSANFYAPYALGLKGATISVAAGCLNSQETDFVNGR